MSTHNDSFAAPPGAPARAARAQAHFLLTEVRAGLTFLDVGETSRREGTPERTRARAREAYDVVARHLAADDVALTADERDEIARLHADLGARLAGHA